MTGRRDTADRLAARSAAVRSPHDRGWPPHVARLRARDTRCPSATNPGTALTALRSARLRRPDGTATPHRGAVPPATTDHTTHAAHAAGAGGVRRAAAAHAA